MQRHVILAVILPVFCTSLCSAAESPELQAARGKFAHLPNPAEVDRQNYLLELSKLRESLANSASGKSLCPVSWPRSWTSCRRNSPANEGADVRRR